MASILNFGVVFTLFACLLAPSGAFRKYDTPHSSENSQEVASPLSSRIRKLPPRYSQHYFSPFQPIQSESKTFMSIPSNAANFFGPQSYWAQMANQLIDNVVGTVGGKYALEKARAKAAKTAAQGSGEGSSELFQTFKKALKKENSTRLQYQQFAEFKQKENKHSHEVSLNTRYPASWKPNQSGRHGNYVFSAEIVNPRKLPATLSPTAAYPPSTTPSSQPPPTEYGILPNLLLRNANARSKFYHLDKYANPQYPAALKRKVNKAQFSSNEYGRDSTFYQTPGSSEIRRMPARIPSTSYYETDARNKASQEIKFRSALKKILRDFRRQHPAPFRNTSRSREFSQIAQQEGSQSNRRRRPPSRRIVHLPARYGSTEEEFRRWRM